ncbi:DUF1538 family protein [bacterium]|nr:DUF1538 family protein [bacterium]
MTEHRHALARKIREALGAVAPVVAIVLALSLSVAPLPSGLVLTFLLASGLLAVGLGVFMLGAETSMVRIGAAIGGSLARMASPDGAGAIRRRGLLGATLVSLLVGVIVTVAEPDLQVLAGNVPHVDTLTLVVVVAVGVGVFLAVAVARALLGVPLRWVLLAAYAVTFLLALLSDPAYLSVAFDAGGATTGPMTAPFIMAVGIGVAAARRRSRVGRGVGDHAGNDAGAGGTVGGTGDEAARAEDDALGMLALCSIGPVLAVLALGFAFGQSTAEYAGETVVTHWMSDRVGAAFVTELPGHCRKVAVALAPVALFYLTYLLLVPSARGREALGALVGLAVTYVGLVLFLLAIDVGFSPLAMRIGTVMGSEAVGAPWTRLLAAPVAALLGWFAVRAEPAVGVMGEQVEELSGGAVSARVISLTLSVAVAAASALSIVRVLLGVGILWFLLPGYAVALALAFVVPPMFTAMAFDAGGVASGPMTATFMLPFAMGLCQAVGGNVVTDAFGLIALVAMTPLVTVQVMGLVSTRSRRRARGVGDGRELTRAH